MFPTQEHIDAARKAAKSVQAKTGFYCWPSVTLAQAIIESARWTLLAGQNNGFGIKANPQQIAAGQYTEKKTKEILNGKEVTITDKFANFPSLYEAYEAHAMLFVRVKVYSAATKAKTARQFVMEMAKYYATAEKNKDPKKRYSTIIIGVMDQMNLYQYDEVTQALATPIKPPAVEVAKTKASAVAGAVVVASSVGVNLSSGNHLALFAGLAVAAVIGAIVVWRVKSDGELISHVPAVPPPVTTQTS